MRRGRWLLALAAVALACAGCGGGSGGETVVSGLDVFQENCARCHAEDGTGGAGPDLTSSDKASDHDAVVEQVTNGGGGMPAFEGDLSDDQIEAVATYVTNEIVGE